MDIIELDKYKFLLFFDFEDFIIYRLIFCVWLEKSIFFKYFLFGIFLFWIKINFFFIKFF